MRYKGFKYIRDVSMPEHDNLFSATSLLLVYLNKTGKRLNAGLELLDISGMLIRSISFNAFIRYIPFSYLLDTRISNLLRSIAPSAG